MKTVLALTAAALISATAVYAQAPGVPIESNGSLLQNAPLLEKAKVLREGGKLLLNIAKVKEQLATPVPAALTLPPAATKPLSGREVAERARTGYLRIGWYYLCPRCDHWHLNLAGGYAIAQDAAATCHHCVAPSTDMREGYLIAVDAQGEVLPVTGIYAKSQTLDAAILHIEGGKYTPLPLNDNVAPGDSAYCFSEPLGQHGYFSQGIVNRFYWRGKAASGNVNSLDEVKQLRVNVSTDWAPGSSGAAVLDQCGNVIGHVSTISPMREGGRAPGTTDNPAEKPADKPAEKEEKPTEKPGAPKPAPPAMPRVDRFNGATLITLHKAVPARGIIALAKSGPAVTPATNAVPAPAPVPGKKKAPVEAREEGIDPREAAAIYTAAEAKPVVAPKDTADAKPVVPKVAVEKAATPAAPTLSIGDAAPPIQASGWAQGEPVKEFARDKAYIVEFWATWCGPCKATIPHVNELYRKFADKGLVVIGQDCWERDVEKVTPFIKEMGEKMTYRIALDTVADPKNPNAGAMATTWMRAAGQNGIPCAFLVDKKGTIAWIGHPAKLKESDIEALLAGTFDIEKSKKQFTEEGAYRKAMTEHSRAITGAIQAKNWEDAEAAAAKLEAALPESRKGDVESIRLRIALGRKDAAAAMKIADKMAAKSDAEASTFIQLARMFATAEGLENVDWAYVEKFARRGAQSAPEQMKYFALDTLARVLFLGGKKDEAVKVQEEAIAAAPEASRKRLGETLEAYKSGKLPARS